MKKLVIAALALAVVIAGCTKKEAKTTSTNDTNKVAATTEQAPAEKK